MQLTLDQAAIRLGKSVRQVRYLVQTGKLSARKVGSRWLIESDDLPQSSEQQATHQRKERQLRAAVERGLELPTGPGRARHSVRDLKASQIALPIYRQLVAALGHDHRATRALLEAIEQLARGCHRFDYRNKAAAYREAREQASVAITALLAGLLPVSRSRLRFGLVRAELGSCAR